MANRYTEDIAAYLLQAGANNIHGITAKDITEALDLPTNTAYRVLRGTGFYKSKLPNWPEGYYYNAKKAITDLTAAESIVVHAETKMKEASYMEQQMTVLGKILSQTEHRNESIVVETIGKLPKSMTMDEAKSYIANAHDYSNFKGFLIVLLVAANRNMIVDNPKLNKMEL